MDPSVGQVISSGEETGRSSSAEPDRGRSAYQGVASAAAATANPDDTHQYESDLSQHPKPETSTYQDFSKLPPLPRKEHVLPSQSETAKEPTFPVKLHMILSNPDHEEVIKWLPHGRSWRIVKQKELEKKVIPLYFRHGRYSSFARQVNGWGFRRVMSGCDYNSYYHPLFLRGLPHLCDRIRRLTPKDMAERKLDEAPPAAPDFYAISRKFPLPESVPVNPSTATVRVPPVFAAAAPSGNEEEAAEDTRTGGGELAALERRRHELMHQMNDPMSPSNPNFPSSMVPSTTNNIANTQGMAPGNQGPNPNHGSSSAGDSNASIPIQTLIAVVGIAQRMQSSQNSGQELNLANVLQLILTVSTRIPNGLQFLAELVNLLNQQSQPPQQQSAPQEFRSAPNLQSFPPTSISSAPAFNNGLPGNMSPADLLQAINQLRAGNQGSQQHMQAHVQNNIPQPPPPQAAPPAPSSMQPEHPQLPRLPPGVSLEALLRAASGNNSIGNQPVQQPPIAAPVASAPPSNPSFPLSNSNSGPQEQPQQPPLNTESLAALLDSLRNRAGGDNSNT
mmetsp:Transcript_18725/g.38742  ORF Transcript_18725/g.38742 Transcript_18725/m.38742 type:complete len:561 (-) Transcript_18725:617-2299(-)|eukprot:CAMPEP_0172446384 /NCGR_PEP_ID=MMETSP1065-20121228/5993_1 /TAXON_ID=265537 /ORGANISM="Amphiprora paludosa, Strain CCMP125" /LENGTH=560 /DNA_ID=CAMNT_0013197489 /DNA_START=160 /DNA_END=1842 /DNA_ORIENTATION=-